MRPPGVGGQLRNWAAAPKQFPSEYVTYAMRPPRCLAQRAGIPRSCFKPLRGTSTPGKASARPRSRPTSASWRRPPDEHARPTCTGPPLRVVAWPHERSAHTGLRNASAAVSTASAGRPFAWAVAATLLRAPSGHDRRWCDCPAEVAIDPRYLSRRRLCGWLGGNAAASAQASSAATKPRSELLAKSPGSGLGTRTTGTSPRSLSRPSSDAPRGVRRTTSAHPKAVLRLRTRRSPGQTGDAVRGFKPNSTVPQQTPHLVYVLVRADGPA